MSRYLPKNTKMGDFKQQRTLSGSFFVIPERLASIRAVVLAFTANKQTNKQTLSIIYIDYVRVDSRHRTLRIFAVSRKWPMKLAGPKIVFTRFPEGYQTSFWAEDFKIFIISFIAAKSTNRNALSYQFRQILSCTSL